MSDYEQGQVDLINHIKKEVAKLEGTTNTADFAFDIINLLKSIKPLTNEENLS
jgi:hypothetical protein